MWIKIQAEAPICINVPNNVILSFLSECNLSVLTDWFASWGKVWMRWAFHLKGMFGLYTASTRTRSPTWGVFPFTALKTYIHVRSHQFQVENYACILWNCLLWPYVMAWEMKRAGIRKRQHQRNAYIEETIAKNRIWWQHLIYSSTNTLICTRNTVRDAMEQTPFHLSWKKTSSSTKPNVSCSLLTTPVKTRCFWGCVCCWWLERGVG